MKDLYIVTGKTSYEQSHKPCSNIESEQLIRFVYGYKYQYLHCSRKGWL